MDPQSLVSSKSTLRSLIILCAIVFLGFYIVGPLLGLWIASFSYEGNLFSDLLDPDKISGLQKELFISQGVTSVVGLLLLPALYLTLIERKPLAPFFFNRSQTVVVIIMIVFIGVNFIVAVSPIIEWNATLEFPDFLSGFEKWARAREDYLRGVTKTFTTFESPGEFFVGLLVVALLPGMGEEFVFRGLFQNELFRGTRNIHVAIWLSAILFSAIHMQFFGFFPRVLLGALFGYLYHWSGNLMIPMFAHFFHNGFTLTMMYLYQIEVIDINVDSEEAAPWGGVLVSSLVTVALLYVFRRTQLISRM